MNAALLGRQTSPQLLISVCTLDEAKIALAQGADIIDLKNPHAGALGALPLADIRSIVAHIKLQPMTQKILTSATLGDLPMQAEQWLPQLDQVIATGVGIIKIGFFATEDYEGCMQALLPYTQAGHQLIAVMFAEITYPDSLLADIKQAGFLGVMLDTQIKNGLSLFDHFSAKQAREFAKQVAAQSLLLGLAGSLRDSHLVAAKNLQPNFIGFRGGVCVANQRQSTLDADKIKVIRKML
ncbi:(5-formylfuran-3-yl)methyl phosphate synthase [Methylophilaceae bacterium]